MRCVFFPLLAISLAAQEPHFDVGSRLVLVPVTVTDRKGHSIYGLETADFRLYDNGRRQVASVDTIDTGVAPVALVVAIQSSGISAAVLDKVRGVGSMIQPLITGERGSAAVMSFADQVVWMQDWTKDPDALDRAFHAVRPVLRPGEEKAAHMLDAVQLAVERLRAQPNTRRVLFLISESKDRGSRTALKVAATAAQSAGVTVYAATYSAYKTAFASKEPVTRPHTPVKPQTPLDEMGSVDGAPPDRYGERRIPPPEQQVDVLGAIAELARIGETSTAEALAKGTGGAIIPFTRQKALEQAIGKLGAELGRQYVISFVPEGSAPGYHTIHVHVTRPGEFQIRARPGYWATDTTP
jgi:VWFA-related protein